MRPHHTHETYESGTPAGPRCKSLSPLDDLHDGVFLTKHSMIREASKNKVKDAL